MPEIEIPVEGVVAVAIGLALAGAMQGAGPSTSKSTCGTCHREEALSFPRTAMGIGMELPPNQQLLKSHTRLTATENGYSYEIKRKRDISIYTIEDGPSSLSLPIRYAFGVRNQTFVLEYEGHFYESMVSYYEVVAGLATTMGDEQVRPRNLVEAMGRLISDQEVASCFDCHSTGGVSGGKLTLDSLTPGLNCEHCHAGANAHMQAQSGGRAAPVPKKLGDMAAEEMSDLCGGCHRTWSSVVGQRIFGEKNVRFQPYRLANSKCFLGDDKRIRCTACHNPHRDLVTDAASYDKACLSCHDVQKPCPVGDKKCAGCHMPKVQAPGSGSIFHDHDILIVHAGDPYPY